MNVSVSNGQGMFQFNDDATGKLGKNWAVEQDGY